MFYVITTENGQTEIIELDETPFRYFQGPFATKEEARKADRHAIDSTAVDLKPSVTTSPEPFKPSADPAGASATLAQLEERRKRLLERQR